MRVLALFLLAFLVSCQAPPAEMTEAEIAQYEVEVREEIISQVDSVNDGFMRGDAEAVLSGYTTDARVYWPGGNLTRDELQEWAVGSFHSRVRLPAAETTRPSGATMTAPTGTSPRSAAARASASARSICEVKTMSLTAPHPPLSQARDLQ